MKVDIRHDPAFAVARAVLASGEKIQVEAGAMMGHSHGIAIESNLQGGMMKSLGRGLLGGESLFTTTYTAPQGGGWVDVAPNLPGEVAVVDITPTSPLVITRGCWLFNDLGVTLDLKWGGLKNLFGGEGGFAMHASGEGTVVVSSYGALEVQTLAPGERFVLDSGHLIACEATVHFTTRRAVQGKTMQSLKSGEGLVLDLVGPGDVITQSRNPAFFAGLGGRQ